MPLPTIPHPYRPLMALVFAVTALAALSACEKKEHVLSPTLAWNDCTGCHNDGARILATAEPDEGGEGGTPGEG
jgi:hypothetical protein